MRTGLASYRLPLTTLVVSFAAVLTAGLFVGERDTTGQSPAPPVPITTEQSSPTGQVQSLTIKILVGGNTPSEDQLAGLDVQLRHPPVSGQKNVKSGEFVFDLPNPNPDTLVCVLDPKAGWKVVTPKTDMPAGISDDSFLWCDLLDSLKSDQGQDHSVTITLETA